jgi:hypothetical protein
MSNKLSGQSSVPPMLRVSSAPIVGPVGGAGSAVRETSVSNPDFGTPGLLSTTTPPRSPSGSPPGSPSRGKVGGGVVSPSRGGGGGRSKSKKGNLKDKLFKVTGLSEISRTFKNVKNDMRDMTNAIRDKGKKNKGGDKRDQESSHLSSSPPSPGSPRSPRPQLGGSGRPPLPTGHPTGPGGAGGGGGGAGGAQSIRGVVQEFSGRQLNIFDGHESLGTGIGANEDLSTGLSSGLSGLPGLSPRPKFQSAPSAVLTAMLDSSPSLSGRDLAVGGVGPVSSIRNLLASQGGA